MRPRLLSTPISLITLPGKMTLYYCKFFCVFQTHLHNYIITHLRKGVNYFAIFYYDKNYTKVLQALKNY